MPARRQIPQWARPVSEFDLWLMRQIDELHLTYPIAGSRMLRDLPSMLSATSSMAPLGLSQVASARSFSVTGFRIGIAETPVSHGRALA